MSLLGAPSWQLLAGNRSAFPQCGRADGNWYCMGHTGLRAPMVTSASSNATSLPMRNPTPTECVGTDPQPSSCSRNRSSMPSPCFSSCTCSQPASACRRMRERGWEAPTGPRAATDAPGAVPQAHTVPWRFVSRWPARCEAREGRRGRGERAGARACAWSCTAAPCCGRLSAACV